MEFWSLHVSKKLGNLQAGFRLSKEKRTFGTIAMQLHHKGLSISNPLLKELLSFEQAFNKIHEDSVSD